MSIHVPISDHSLPHNRWPGCPMSTQWLGAISTGAAIASTFASESPRCHAPSCLASGRFRPGTGCVPASAAQPTTPLRAPRREAQRIKRVAPMTSNRRMSRCPIYEVSPALLAPGGMLPRHQAEPCGEISPLGGMIHRRREGLDRQLSDRGPTGHRCNWRGISASFDKAAILAFSASIRPVSWFDLSSRSIWQISQRQIRDIAVRISTPLPGVANSNPHGGEMANSKRAISPHSRLGALVHELFARRKRKPLGLACSWVWVPQTHVSTPLDDSLPHRRRHSSGA